MDGHDLAAADPWWYPDDYPGEAAPLAVAADDEFPDIEGLLGLAWEGAPHAPPAERPPSEDVMAAWLFPIVSGEGNAGAGPMMKSEPSAMTMGSLEMTESKGKLPASDGVYDVKETNTRSDPSERMKAASGGSNRTRSSYHSDTHNVTEKRRRCKISDRMRTLQQLVPGCEKTASPLAPPVAVAPGTVAAGGCVPLLPAGMAPMLTYPPYHAVMVPAQAAAPPFYLPQPTASAAPKGHCSVSTEQHYKKEQGRRRL
ncbi:hypothetical protein VPH35_074888 [Triticum aestivum]